MSNNFLNLGVSQQLQEILTENRINKPTQIQIKAIPQILKNQDVIAQAQTGTGKTLAFILPIIEKIDVQKSGIQALIIAPTRELAIQITGEAKKFAKHKDIKILAAYGGQDVEAQVRKLKGGVHMVIATPGRLLDHIKRGTVSFGKLSMLVLDEADEMLRMGFLNEVQEIIMNTPKRRQTMFFSATIPQQIRNLAKEYMNKPCDIKVESKSITLDSTKQLVVQTTDRRKQDTLCKYLDEQNPFMAVIFCRTKRRVGILNEALSTKGYNCCELHGDLSQAKRERIMKDCKKAKYQYLIATDVAARGIDIDGMTHVFNYDVPEDAESYIHRIGRTGRAGKSGMAITFVAEKDMDYLADIEKGIKMSLKKVSVTKEELYGDNPPKTHEKVDGYENNKPKKKFEGKKRFDDKYKPKKKFDDNKDKTNRKKPRQKSTKKSY